ncbi:hypothetical protein HYU72_02365, partial [Candidatus Berkelbacteria bacterium]|nr:hypothetical protein [Candidatus Berkelbacteria bacterium]
MEQVIPIGQLPSKMKKILIIIIILTTFLGQAGINFYPDFKTEKTNAQETNTDITYTPDPDDPYDIPTDEPDRYNDQEFGEESNDTGKLLAKVNEVGQSTESIFFEISSLDRQKIGLTPYDEQELFKYWQVYKALQTDSATLEYYKKNGQPPQNILDELQIDQLQPYDIRIIRLLNYLVKPKDQGGAGHEFIRAKRIRSGYRTENRSLSRESDFEVEESPNISAHFSGQAVDISEVDLLKCTLLKRRYVGTRRIKQSPKPIKVAWQTEEGAGREMPAGQTFDDLASLLGPAELNELLGPGGQVRSSSFENLFWQIGRARLEEELELPVGSLSQTTEQTFFEDLASALLAKDTNLNFSRIYNIGAYSSFLETASPTELYARLTLNALENDLGLPRGSIDLAAIRQAGDLNDFYQVLKSIGQRKVEIDLGLTPGYLAGENPDWGQVRDRVGQKKHIYEALDESLGWPTTALGANDSSTKRLLNQDQRVFYVLGALTLARALNYEPSSQIALLQAVERGQINLEISFFNREFSFPISLEQLEAIFSKNKKDEDTAAEDAYVAEHRADREAEWKKQMKESTGQEPPLNAVIRGQMEQMIREEYRQKKAGERNESGQNRKTALEAIGQQIFQQAGQRKIGLPEAFRDSVYLLAANKARTAPTTVNDLVKILSDHNLDELFRFAAFRQMENALELPTYTLFFTFYRDRQPNNLVQNLGEARILEVLNQNQVKDLTALLARYKNSDLAVDRLFFLTNSETYEWRLGRLALADYQKAIGQNFLQKKVISTAMNLFDLNLRAGGLTLSPDDVVYLLRGQISPGILGALMKIGAGWTEAELGLPVNFINQLVSTNDPIEALWVAGGQRMGRVFGLARLDILGISNVSEFQERLGQEKVEQTLALGRDSFALDKDINYVKQQNGEERSAKIFQEPSKIDRLFSLSAGTTQQLLENKISLRDYALKVSDQMVLESVLKNLDIDQILGLDEQYEIKGNDLYQAIKQGDWTKLKNNLLARGAGLTIDNILKVDAGTTERIVATRDEKEQIKILAEQGGQKLGRMLGLSEDDSWLLTRAYLNDQFSQNVKNVLAREIAEATHLPYDAANPLSPQNRDVYSFVEGRLGQGLTLVGLAAFAEQNKEAFGNNQSAAYLEMRLAIYGDPNFNDLSLPSPERDFINQQIENSPERAVLLEDPAARARFTTVARRQFRSRQLRNFNYRLIDYHIRKIDPRLPEGFTQALLEGTDQQRNQLLVNYLRGYALEQLTQLGLTAEESNRLYTALSDGRIDENDLNNLSSALFSRLDANLGQQLFGQQLPAGTFQALFNYLAKGENMPSNLKVAYEQWAGNYIFNWLDQQWFGGQFGLARDLYQSYRTYKTAYDAYQAAKAAGDASQIAEASKNYNNVRANVYALAAAKIFNKQFQQADRS